MNQFRQAFASGHVVLPVIHVASLEQAQRNALVAREAGADGVFLINHHLSDAELLEIHGEVVRVHGAWWVGVNCLGLSPEQVFHAVSPGMRGVWVDDSGIDERQAAQPFAERVLALRQARSPGCLYFGGVAFKYRRRVDDLDTACRIAARFVDVVTTSGPGTGLAADVRKIERMKRVLGQAPLAIASGITPDNVEQYVPHADCFLVATGISRSFTELDPERVCALVTRVRSCSA